MKWLGILILLILLFPQVAKAEIATTKDWIGLFQNQADGKNNALPIATPNPVFTDGHMWVYTSSCSQTAGSTPKVADPAGCRFTFDSVPTTGTYEFRMYANDKETSDALLAKSIPMSAGAVVGAGAGAAATKGNNNCENHSTVLNGLISATDITRSGDTFGNNTGTCIVDNKAAFAPYKIPSYDDLKSLYYTQAKTSSTYFTKTSLTCATCTHTNIPMTGGNDRLYYVPTDLTISGNILGGGARTGVVFIEGTLTINQNINGNQNTGLVFVVGGDVTIASSVTRIDAVIISAGKIYTAGAGCSLAANAGTNNQLVVNGSLISLDPLKPIAFCRKLTDNSLSAEKIIQQPKYLVILKDLMSDTWQKWSEI